MTQVIHYIFNIKIKDFLLCQYVIIKKSIIDKYIYIYIALYNLYYAIAMLCVSLYDIYEYYC